MPIVCGVKFRGIGKVYYFAPPEDEELVADDLVVVETSRGRELGQIVFPDHEVGEDEIVGDLKPIVRRASSLDLLEMQRYCHQADAAVEQCRQEIESAGLLMKIVGAEYSYDGSRLTFFFTAEQRVDFRELVRKLARTFKTRIELRQIGVRDEAKIVGGFGKCGRPLCCATWLTHFSPVSIRMAKQQDLPLSPMEISGVCGRLLCCLAYENNYYGQVKGRFPRIGRVIDTPAGRARVIKVSVLKETVDLLLEDGSTLEMSAAQLAGEEPFEDKPLNTIQQRLAESSIGQSEAQQPTAELQRARNGGERARSSRPSAGSERRSPQRPPQRGVSSTQDEEDEPEAPHTRGEKSRRPTRRPRRSTRSGGPDRGGDSGGEAGSSGSQRNQPRRGSSGKRRSRGTQRPPQDSEPT
jgi:cell fate regulator YaaT (PSP1 superfamily)